jgi:hypothetical protein
MKYKETLIIKIIQFSSYIFYLIISNYLLIPYISLLLLIFYILLL